MSVQAENISTDFNEANKLYEQGKYSEAAARYETILQAGSVSAPVYFNLGNAFLKSGRVGRAIAAYRNAEKLSPRDPDVRTNLQFAREQAGGGATVPTLRWSSWIGRLTLNEWTILTMIVVSVLFLLLAIRQWRFNLKISLRGFLMLIGILGAFLLVCLATAIHQEFFVRSAVVIVPEAVVRPGPFDESPGAFTLRDGAEVTVLDQKENWLQIADATQRTGWLPEKNVMSIGRLRQSKK
ncbi:MAG: tetratricopeptide repeat protein [Verrucomicrobiota bacterium]